MISDFKIITGVLSFYIGCGLLYGLFISYRINNWRIDKLLKFMIYPPYYISILNFIFYPTTKIMNYIRLRQIIAEEKLEDLLEGKCDK